MSAPHSIPEKTRETVDRRLSVAPMLDWTDRYCRYFLRQISRHVVLYTEMITTGALLHGDPARFLDFDPDEHPLALQLGGSEPKQLAECVRLADGWHFDEVNLNVGCPSDRVQSGRFGACLMAEPELVADCVGAMKEAALLPVTVKHRIGIDELDSYDELTRFIATVATAGQPSARTSSSDRSIVAMASIQSRFRDSYKRVTAGPGWRSRQGKSRAPPQR